MREGDFYPHLRHAMIKQWTMIIREQTAPPARNWADSFARYAIGERHVPALEIRIPERDWEAIMEIYRAHFHAENTNPGVKQAWEQYKIMCAMTRP